MGLGKLLSGVLQVVTLPIDIVEIGMDMATGGSGSKQSRKSADLPLLSNLRDEVAKALEDIDN